MSVSEHADAVVAEAMEEEDCAAVRVMGVDAPGVEVDLIGSRDGCVTEVGVEAVGEVAGGGDFFGGQGTARGVEGGVGDEDAGHHAEGQVEGEGQESVAGAAGHGLIEVRG